MRVVFAGTTGVQKLRLMQAVASLAAREAGKSIDLNHSETQAFIHVLDLDNEIDKTLGGGRKAFLDMLNPHNRDETWYKVFEKKIRELSGYDGHVFLGIHNWCLRKGQFFSCVNWDLLVAFRPTVFIALFDDVYDVWQRVNNYEKEKLKTNSYFRLDEILEWRSAEILATDILANNLFLNPEKVAPGEDLKRLPVAIQNLFGRPIPHFTVAVKHPVTTFYRLLFRRRDYPVVYTSFPITDTRDSKKRREPIDQFRKKLHDSFTAFDPLTIDEFRFNKEQKRTGSRVRSVLKPRWNALPRGIECCVPETPLRDNPFRGFDKVYLHSLKASIGNRVVSRDLRLVEQADATVGFRPFYGGQPQLSRGMDKEFLTASFLGKGLYIYHPDEDEQGQSNSIFDSLQITNPIVCKDLDELYLELERYKTSYIEKFAYIPNTWEREASI